MIDINIDYFLANGNIPQLTALGTVANLRSQLGEPDTIEVYKRKETYYHYGNVRLRIDTGLIEEVAIFF